MQNYTLTISKKNAKAKALIEYLKTLDFIQLTKNSDSWDEISTEEKASIKRGLNDLENDRVHNDHDVRSSIRERILKSNKG
jgi:hypothetical protein